MRLRKSGLSALGIAVGMLVFLRAAARADAPSDDVVARVGTQKVTGVELERMIANVQSFQLRTLGATPAEMRANFLDRVLVREMLLAEGAVDEHLGQRPDVEERIQGVLRSALILKISAETAAAAPITDAEVKDYYDKKITRYSTPARVAIWRILVNTREEAQGVLDEAKKDPRAAKWDELARDKSLDKATSMRGGALGFVSSDGVSSEPGVRVDPAIAAAAAGVQDGEFVPAPVPEGPRWAAVWRKQSMKPMVRTLAQETPAIRQTLAHERAEAKVKDLLAGLWKEHVSNVSEDLVDQVELAPGGEVRAATRPGVLPTSRHPSAGPPAPSPPHLR